MLQAVKQASKKQTASGSPRHSESEQGEEVKKETMSEASLSPAGSTTPASSVGGKKRAKMSVLAERMRRQKKDPDSVSAAGSTNVNESTPATPQMFNKVERVKPTTPPLKKKFVSISSLMMFFVYIIGIWVEFDLNISNAKCQFCQNLIAVSWELGSFLSI